jgi:D-serine deaminase-like pyridoxal phosphate-dependent protein
VSADAGVPTCKVVGRPSLTATTPSEEHLPIHGDPRDLPQVGDLIELVPRHVCPTVNLYDAAILVEPEGVNRLIEVEARGHASACAGSTLSEQQG